MPGPKGGSGPRGAWSRGYLVWGVPGLGGLDPGVPGPGEVWSWGGGVPVGDTLPGRLLLRVVRILLESILVLKVTNDPYLQANRKIQFRHTDSDS